MLPGLPGLSPSPFTARRQVLGPSEKILRRAHTLLSWKEKTNLHSSCAWNDFFVSATGVPHTLVINGQHVYNRHMGNVVSHVIDRAWGQASPLCVWFKFDGNRLCPSSVYCCFVLGVWSSSY